MTMLIPDQLRMTVAGMTCEACAVCVGQALEAAGARAVQVDVGRKEASFTLPSGVEPRGADGRLSARPGRAPAGNIKPAPPETELFPARLRTKPVDPSYPSGVASSGTNSVSGRSPVVRCG